MLVHNLLYGLDPRLAWPGSMAVILGAFVTILLRVVAPRPGLVWTRRLLRLGIAAILALAAIQCAVAATYLVYPSYLDVVEPATAAVSWLSWHGSAVYPPIASGNFYAPVYGPILYQGTGLFLVALWPSIAISKIPGLVAFVAAQVLSYVLLRRSGGRPLEALTIAAAQCLVQAGFDNQAYTFGVRADPWLFLFAAASTLVATSTPSVAKALILGCLAGTAVNLKADAVLYIAPVTVFFLCRTASFAERSKLAALGLGTAMLAFAAPFVAGNVSILDYLTVLEDSSQRTLSRWLAEQGIVMIALELGPPLLIYLVCRPALPRGFVPFAIATVACMSVVIVPASADGAGPHHFLPFLPSLSWAFLVLFRASLPNMDGKVGDRRDSAVLGLTISLVVGYGPIVVQSWESVLRNYANFPVARMAADEIVGVLDRFPNENIGISPGLYSNYDVSGMRVIPVFLGRALLVDPVTWTGYQYNNESQELFRKMLSECRAGIWLLAHGSQFGMDALVRQTIFSQAVVDEFRRDYALLSAGHVYDVWRCNGASVRPTP